MWNNLSDTARNVSIFVLLVRLHHYMTISVWFIHKSYMYTYWILYYCHRQTWVMRSGSYWVMGQWRQWLIACYEGSDITTCKEQWHFRSGINLHLNFYSIRQNRLIFVLILFYFSGNSFLFREWPQRSPKEYCQDYSDKMVYSPPNQLQCQWLKVSKVFPDPRAPIKRRAFLYLYSVALSQTTACNTVRPPQRLVHRVVCLFTTQLSLLSILPRMARMS